MQESPVDACDTTGTQRQAHPVGLFLCSCTDWPDAELDRGVIERCLRHWAPGPLLIVRDDLCRAPDRVAELSARAQVAGAVIPACAARAGLGHVLKRAGARPWAIETVDLPTIAGTTRDTHDIPRQLAAAVVRVRSLLHATPAHLKVSYAPPGDTFDRRALLRSLLEPTYQVVPAVEASCCAPSQGCRLCLAACPVGALRLGSASITLTKKTCTACGACVSICPSQAISWPGFSLQDLDAQLAALFACPEGSRAPDLLLLTCPRRTPTHMQLMRDLGTLARDIVVLSAPCAVLASPALLLRAFERGAQGVAVLGCPEACPEGHTPAQIRQTVGFVVKILEALGVAGQRLALLEGPSEGDGNVPESVRRFRKAVTSGPPIPGPAQDQTPGDSRELSLAAILSRLWAAFVPPTSRVLAGADVPFGLMHVTAPMSCTMCGVCEQTCPSRALRLVHSPTEETLTFSHAHCVACGVCVAQCPEHVLHLERALDVSQLSGPVQELARDRVHRCHRCQEILGSARMLAKVEQVLRFQPGGALWNPGEVCASCRLAGTLRVTRMQG